MNLTLITTACARPEAWAITEKSIAAQTLKPFQWLVLDDDEPQSVCTLGQEYFHWKDCMVGKESLIRKMRRAIRDDLIKGDAVVFIENDDHYAPDYLAWVASMLEKHTLVGEARALYYNVRDRFWYEHQNGAPAERGKPKHSQHASLCSTSIRRDGFVWLARQCAVSAQPFLDVRLWNRAPFPGRILLADPLAAGGKRRTVGIKGMPGRVGYGMGHGERDRAAQDDFDLSKLRELIGADCEAYAPFWSKYGAETPIDAPKPVESPAIAPEIAVSTLATPTIVVDEPNNQVMAATVVVQAAQNVANVPVAPEALRNVPPGVIIRSEPIGTGPFAKGHGPNWWKWLKHLQGTPAVHLEIGVFRGESAKWYAENIGTHPDSRIHCVDWFQGSQEHQLHKIDVSTTEADARATLAPFPNVQIHVGKSQDIVRPMNLKLSSAYIDGSHVARDVLRDLILVFDLLQVGGTAILDDYGWEAVPGELNRPKVAIDAFVKIFSPCIEVLKPVGFQLAFKKIGV